MPLSGMPCPVCRVPLVMSERHGVEIDYCPQCRGVWLDRGELGKIIERSTQDVQPAGSAQSTAFSTSHYDRGHGDAYSQPYGHGHHKRKKSFFEELFD